MDGHGVDKFRDAGLIATSANRSWTALSAEIRSHGRSEIPAFTPQNAEITRIIRDTPDAVSKRASGGVVQEVRATPRTTWLCPAGIREEATRLSADMPEVLHVYIPPHSFLGCMDQGLAFSAFDLRYQAAVQNPLVHTMMDEVEQELRRETSSGGLKMDELAVSLIVALARDHAETSGPAAPTDTATGALDRMRLHRVLEFIESRLDQDLNVNDLAEVACLSVFHFARAFRAALGRSPHAYLSERRLDRAKQLLSYTRASLAEVALTCRFSNQANFSRAFKRAMGVSPGRYRSATAAG